MIMFIGQLSGRNSFRDLVMNVSVQLNKLYHLGLKRCSRTTLARVNEKQPTSLYEAVFGKLLKRTQQFAPKHRFKFNGKLYLLDATVVDLCLSVFPWAKFRQTKGAIKINVDLDGDGYLLNLLISPMVKNMKSTGLARKFQSKTGEFNVTDTPGFAAHLVFSA